MRAIHTFSLVFVATLFWTVWESGLAARGLAALLALVFIGAVLWAFAPHNTFRSGATVARGSAVAPRAVPANGASVQPADAPADSDWAAYGRNNAATRWTDELPAGQATSTSCPLAPTNDREA